MSIGNENIYNYLGKSNVTCENEKLCDCNGNDTGECISYVKDMSYTFNGDVYSPVFVATTWGSKAYLTTYIMRDMYKERKDFIVHLKYPLKVGDILKIEGYCCGGYYVKKILWKDRNGYMKYGIARIDNNPMRVVDMDKFKKGKRLFVVNYLKNIK